MTKLLATHKSDLVKDLIKAMGEEFFEEFVKELADELGTAVLAKIVGEAQKERDEAKTGKAASAAPASASKPAVTPLTSSKLDPMLCAVANTNFNSAPEGHQKMYWTFALLAGSILSRVQAQGDREVLHYAKSLHKLANICSSAVELLGQHPGIGLNAMLKYVSGAVFTCVADPEAASFSASAANAALEACKAEQARIDRGRCNGGGGGNGSGGSNGGGQDSYEDRDSKRRHEERRPRY